MNETLFEIPIYSCNQSEYVARVEAEAAESMASVPNYGNGFWEKQRQDEIQRHLKSVRFNELIGCVEVHVMGSQLRADYWFTIKKRIVIGSKDKGVIKPKGKLLEKHYSRSASSSLDLFHDFRKALLQRINQHSRLKKRFIDFDAFDRCGPHVNWRAILKLPSLTISSSQRRETPQALHGFVRGRRGSRTR